MPIYYRTFSGNIPDSRTTETIMTDVEHAGFIDLIYITDRDYMSVRNLEKYILKNQRAIMCIKVGLKIVLDKIKAFGDFSVKPEGMDIDIESKLYYQQYNIDYEVKSKGNAIKKADRLRLNLYFNPTLRAEQLRNLDADIAEQKQFLDNALKDKVIVDDKKEFKKEHQFYEIDFNADSTVKSYKLNQKKYEST